MKGTNMNLSFGLEVIYEDADFHIDAHDKAGIVVSKRRRKNNPVPCFDA